MDLPKSSVKVQNGRLILLAGKHYWSASYAKMLLGGFFLLIVGVFFVSHLDVLLTWLGLLLIAAGALGWMISKITSVG